MYYQLSVFHKIIFYNKNIIKTSIPLLLEQHYGAMAQCLGDLVALLMNERSLRLSSLIPQILVCVERRHPVDHLEAARETMNYLAFAAMSQPH